MPRPHHAEVAMVYRRKLWLIEALYDRKHGGVYETDVGIRISQHEFPDTNVVGFCQVHDPKDALRKVVEERCECTNALVASNPPFELDYNRAWDKSRFWCRAEQLGASTVNRISTIERGDEWPSIEN